MRFGRELGFLAVALALAAGLAAFLDLEPRVESDFFFASDDPQLAAAREIEKAFPGSPQILVASRSADPLAEEAVERTRILSDALLEVDGVTGVRSLTHGPATPAVVPKSPVWRRLLLGGDPGLALLVVEVDPDRTGPELVAAVEEVLASVERPSFSLAASGVPFVVEQIRRRLSRDLRVFSLASTLLLVVASFFLQRSVAIVAGTVAACALACTGTLALLGLAGVPIGLLTANLVTIVLVLTLSHTLFLGAARRRHVAEVSEGSVAAPVRATLGEVVGASFWCMFTTLCGFLSLLVADAQPLRELGVAGAVGTVVAFLSAYVVFPLFLRDPWPGTKGKMRSVVTSEVGRPSGWMTPVLALLVIVAGLGLSRVVTDPPLPSYFAREDPIRRGLEAIDRSGGSSPLEILVSDPKGRVLDTKEAVRRLGRAQEALEADAAVGSSLSLPVLLEEARRNPLAGFLDDRSLIGFLLGPTFDEVARTFVTNDRLQARFLLRMHEADRVEARSEVVGRLVRAVESEDLRVDVVGGLYDLQGRLGRLVSGSLLRGLGGLLGLFVLIGALASRSLRATSVMALGLATVPVILVGLAGWVGRPLDLIASPALNVAIALGVDSMIHLVVRARRGGGDAAAWIRARSELRAPILEAAILVGLGFGVFGLSSFPPTRTFGSLVAAGAILAVVVALQVLPRWGAPEGP